MLNIELKARCEDLGRLRERLMSLGAEGQEPERQIDTYFRVAHGRLKLRESLQSGPELIHYIRGDVAGARESHYEIYRLEDAEGLKAILEKALGVKAVVAKRREIYLIENVRVHLDKVQDLGSFVELEGIVENPAELVYVGDEVQRLRQALGIEDRALVKESYADLMGTVEVSRGPRDDRPGGSS
jgi:predicted adenylyl cyclase CyaB